MIVFWSEDAEGALFAMAPSQAERIVSSVEQFAATKRGFVRIVPEAGGEARLYLQGYYVVIEENLDSLRVLGVHAR